MSVSLPHNPTALRRAREIHRRSAQLGWNLSGAEIDLRTVAALLDEVDLLTHQVREALVPPPAGSR